jgi:hypothetical protein
VYVRTCVCTNLRLSRTLHYFLSLSRSLPPFLSLSLSLSLSRSCASEHEYSNRLQNEDWGLKNAFNDAGKMLGHSARPHARRVTSSAG